MAGSHIDLRDIQIPDDSDSGSECSLGGREVGLSLKSYPLLAPPGSFLFVRTGFLRLFYLKR